MTSRKVPVMPEAVQVTRHLLAEDDEVWWYDVRCDGMSIGYDLVSKEANDPYTDAVDSTDEWADLLAAIEPA